MDAAGVAEVHHLLWAVREARRGEDALCRRRRLRLRPEMAELLEAPLAAVCSALAERVTRAAGDMRAADACIRFYGLGRMPEDMKGIAASLPRARGARGLAGGGPLGERRVKDLLVAAEARLAHDLQRVPIVLDELAPAVSPAAPGRDRARSPGQDGRLPAAVAGPVAVPAPVPPRSRDRWAELRVLLWAWADVPDGDHQSATALLLFEEEAGLRPPILPPRHREARRRLRRRARAILDVAATRGAWQVVPAQPRIATASELLLGARTLTSPGVVPAIEEIVRSRDGAPQLDKEALWCLCDQVHRLVHTGSDEAPVLLGLARAALALAGDGAPVEAAVRVLTLSTILARWRDDPAGFPAAWETLRLVHGALRDEAPSPAGARSPFHDVLVSHGLRALQELAELQGRFGFGAEALRTLGCAHQFLGRFGDPEAEQQPDGWLQQLLYSESLVQRLASRSSTRPWEPLTAAKVAARRSAELVWRTDLLPDDWGLAVESILVEALVDEVEHELASDPGQLRPGAVARAERAWARNEAGWQAHGTPVILPSLSARLATVRSACRLAVATGDVEAYRHHRARARQVIGPWLLPGDVEDLDAMEAAAATALGVEPLRLTAPAIRSERSVGQRLWSRPVSPARH